MNLKCVILMDKNIIKKVMRKKFADPELCSLNWESKYCTKSPLAK